MTERRLGRGLGSLLGDGSPAGQLSAGAELALHAIRPNPFQPRRLFDPDSLQELRESIQKHGVLQPIVVRRVADGFEIIAGERRWRAARLAGLERIPATVRDTVGDSEMLELALVENVQRQDLNPIERAQGFRLLMENLAITQEQVADKVGLRRSTVTNHLRLLGLDPKVQDMVAHGLVAMGHARALLGLPSPADQVRLAQRIVMDDLSAREVERMVRAARGPEPVTATAQPIAGPPPWVGEIERRMSDKLGTRVSVRLFPGGSRGEVAIDFADTKGLERIYAILAPKDRLE